MCTLNFKIFHHAGKKGKINMSHIRVHLRFLFAKFLCHKTIHELYSDIQLPGLKQSDHNMCERFPGLVST